MRKKIISILFVTFLIATVIPVMGNVSQRTFLYFDVGVGEPSNIHNGDYRILGDDSLYVTVRNYGDLLTSVELNFTLEKFEGIEPIEVLDEGFEYLPFPPDNWLIHHDGNQHQWQHDTIIGHESSSSAGLFTIWPPTPPMIFDEWLVTESYDLSDAESLTLSVWYYGHANSGVITSNLEIWTSTDGGTDPDDFLTTGILLEEINPLADEVWIPESVDLSPVLGEDDVNFAFRFEGEESDFIEFFIDDILIEGEEYDWGEIDTSSNGPYDLDPDVWIESFFDVYYDFEGEYRATFSLDTPLRGNWSDDNPDNDVYKAVFTVIENVPPDEPTISGEQNGKAGTEYEYTFNAEDPNGDNVKYHIDWDDGNSDTTEFNPSGIDVKVKHTWTNQDTYTIKVTAEDTDGLVGPEGTYTVTMPRNKIINRPFLNYLQSFLTCHPSLFPILQQLLLRMELQ